jgi:hypothetical protein
MCLSSPGADHLDHDATSLPSLPERCSKSFPRLSQPRGLKWVPRTGHGRVTSLFWMHFVAGVQTFSLQLEIGVCAMSAPVDGQFPGSSTAGARKEMYVSHHLPVTNSDWLPRPAFIPSFPRIPHCIRSTHSGEHQPHTGRSSVPCHVE